MKQFFDEIKKDHQEVKGIMKKLTDTSGTKQREELFSKLKLEIKPHMKAEERAFYPALTEKKESREEALESMEEHHVTEMVLNELDKLEKAGDQWLAKMKVFTELVEHHIEEEEKNVLKAAKKVLNKDEMSTIYDNWHKEKEQLKSQMK